jgi:hypothetical protein
MWSHNDDGEPLVFALRFTGEAIRRFEVPGVENIDWEDIALDNEGILYIYDNTSRSSRLGVGLVHAFPEPNPFEQDEIESVETFTIRFPEAEPDIETLIVQGRSAFLVSKPWDGSLPKIYFVEDLRQGTAEVIGTIPHRAMITGGDISADGRRIALSSYRALFIFEKGPEDVSPFNAEPLVCQLNAGQVEGISWDGSSLHLTNEQRSTFLVSESSWRNHEAPFEPSPLLEIPRVSQKLSAGLPLSQWNAGAWMFEQEDSDEEGISARLAWNEVGLHVGVEFPWDLEIAPLPDERPKDLDHWFDAGRVYLMLNPEGDRPTDYGDDDRCLVMGRLSDGRIGAVARFLRPATVIEGSELMPEWIRVEEEGQRLLITYLNRAPGLGTLEQGREMGFNLLVTRAGGEMISWAPLTTNFSWDAPSLWGSIRLK